MHTVNKEKKKGRLKQAFSLISPHTIKFLKPLLFILTVEFLWFAIAFYIDMESDPVRAISLYSSISEHLMMSLLISIGCGVIFDISIAKDK